ncbi:MAG TPA: response regulator [Flavisolibacter sp.]|jgi:CheY-like chemotaxis protein|nr:response regulator [Flavisolibacter sp.]
MNQRKHVLLADDDPDHALLFRRVLQQTDGEARLSTVYDGSSLLKFLTADIPDLLFLDLNMPCKNGFECLEAIRNEMHLETLPVVVFSSSSYMTDIQKSYLHKADLYLVKPFNSFHLRNALEAILSMNWKHEIPDQKYYFMNNRFVPFTGV